MIKSIRSAISKTAVAAVIGISAFAISMPLLTDLAFAIDPNNNNHGDTDYNSWINYNSVSFTDARDKLDDTSSWDACYSGPNHKVEVFATDHGWNPTYVGSTAYYFGPGASSYLTNYVYEEGYPRALLWFSEPNYSGTISGVWSPDSI